MIDISRYADALFVSEPFRAAAASDLPQDRSVWNFCGRSSFPNHPGSQRICCEVARQWLDMAKQGRSWSVDLKRGMEGGRGEPAKSLPLWRGVKLNLLSSHGIGHDCAGRA